MPLPEGGPWTIGFHREELLVGPYPFGPVRMKDDFFQHGGTGMALINKVQNSRAVYILPAILTGSRLGEGRVSFPAANALKAFDSHVYSGRILSPLTGEA
jgi:hypothetical protein